MTDSCKPRVLGDLMEERAARNAERVFLRFKDKSFTYAR